MNRKEKKLLTEKYIAEFGAVTHQSATTGLGGKNGVVFGETFVEGDWDMDDYLNPAVVVDRDPVMQKCEVLETRTAGPLAYAVVKLI